MDTTRSAPFSQSFVTLPLLISLLLHPHTIIHGYTILASLHVQNLKAHSEVKATHRHQQKKAAKPKARERRHVAIPLMPIGKYSRQQVTDFIKASLIITHEPRSWEKPLLWMAWRESRFYVRAVDGTPAANVDLAGDAENALGLMQVVPSTFRAHAMRGMDNIWNPVDNVVAAVRYIRGRYGSPYRISGVMTDQYDRY